ncbi:type I polyketide synthase [Paenibacillus tyrfis]|uniref:type I polyketide synthase n=1 Tax=Paenibacillus tyrfis TaxID=1501230 RepID=UPI0020A16D50|nr:type I polyketide synthase [Paenibacillus tyrfis]MCP1311720.1 acyltransferase domain-containing protein [Paenibacillus tyrfis]
MKVKTNYTGLEIAVVGMSGRFPGADDVASFWSNLTEGVESISFFTDEELLASGVEPELLAKPNYVRAKGVFPRLEYFDAEFFNYTPRDAAMMDPQVRALHEEVYHALEDAGYASEQYRGSIGLFVGASGNFVWELETMKSTVDSGGLQFATLQLNDKDFAATRIAYSLNLQGPCVTVHCACSTSLYAVDMACRHILTGACSIAVAGGSGLTLPHRKGYLFEDGMINSPDGHCRPFDRDAKGTVEGNGTGVVVLKSLEDAIRDRDRIYAVIRGTGVNNDGNRKVGFTAPSVEGQAEVIRRALMLSDVPPETVSYIEAHGTGTILGDPIEVAGLKKAFQSVRPGSCGIGSLKSNIGHLDVAAGISSFIKTVLALDNRIIPASLNFEAVNPNIDLDNSPFRIVSETENWQRKPAPDEADAYLPLRAGVSSFGIGGTNVHVVLEEAPEREPSGAGREWNVLCLSARTDTALRRMQEAYIAHLERHRGKLEPADLAWSAQTGKRSLPERFSIAYRGLDDLAEGLKAALDGVRPPRARRTTAPSAKPAVYFLFPGQGSQYPGMARDLYRTEPAFRRELEACLRLAEAEGMGALRRVLLEPEAGDEETILETDMAQLSLFAVEYALARLLMSWGIQPSGMIGHSLGEYTAACLAGVFSLEDGIRLVTARGRLMKSMPRGSMLAVNASAEAAGPYLTDALSVAAMNSPSQCTLSGNDEAIAEAESRLAAAGIRTRKVRTSHAFHSALMDGALAPFGELCAGMKLQEPGLPYVSNLTGDWIKPEEAVDPSYYPRHLRGSVRFEQGLAAILADSQALLLEVGPGRVLSTFARQAPSGNPLGVVGTLRNAQEEEPDDAFLAERLGELWSLGIAPDWKAYYQGQARNRVTLPLYRFDETVFPLGRGDYSELMAGNQETAAAAAAPAPMPAVAERAGRAGRIVWESAFLPPVSRSDQPRACLVMADDAVSIRRLLQKMPRWRSLLVESGASYHFKGTLGSTVRPGSAIDLYRLIRDLQHQALLPDTIVLARSTGSRTEAELRLLVHVLKSELREALPEVVVLSPVSPISKAEGLVALVRSLRTEIPRLSLRLVDAGVPLSGKSGAVRWAGILERELGSSAHPYPAVCYSGEQRLVPRFRDFHEAAWSGASRFQGRHLIVLSPEDRLPAPLAAAFVQEGARVSILPYRLQANSFDKETVRALLQELNAEQERYTGRFGIEDLSVPHRLMDEYAARLSYDFVQELFLLPPGRLFDTDEFMEGLAIVGSLGKYGHYFLHMFVEDGILEARGEGRYQVTDKAGALRHPADIRADIGRATPLFSGQLNLLEHCVRGFRPALKGEVPALAVLYPGGNNQMILDAYNGSVQEKEDELIKEMFSTMLTRIAGRKKRIRILEAGGGYGAILRRIAPSLKDMEIEYYFTDVGSSFVDSFRKFALEEDLQFMHFGVLDITRDPGEQGFEPASFDLVFAYNVVHATHRLSVSLGNMQRLLKPGGLLCVLERTRVRRYVDLIWGLADGWWHFDEAERKLSPLVSVEEWQGHFSALGLEEVAAYPDKTGLRERLDVGIIIGQRAAAKPPADAKASPAWPEGVRRLRTVAAADASALELALDAALADRTDVEDIMLWDIAEPAKFRRDSFVPAVAEAAKAAIAANRVAVRASARQSKPAMIMSALPEPGDWGPDLTAWVAGHEELDASANVYRIYLPREGVLRTESVVPVLETMLESGVRRTAIDAGHHPLFEPALPAAVSSEESKASRLEGLEATIGEVWSRLLGREEIDPDADFFAIGGDSFKLIQMTMDLEREGSKVLMNEVYKYPTIRSLARYLEEESKKENKDIAEAADLVAILADTADLGCHYRIAQDAERKESLNLLFVDELTAEGADTLRKQLRQLRVPGELLPHYILPSSLFESMPDAVTLEDLHRLGVLSDSEQSVLESFDSRIDEARRRFNEAILNQPVVSRYGLSNAQRMHFRSETRLQMYLIEFNDLVDEQVLEQAFCDVVGSHGLLRSCLYRTMWEYRWKEHAPPQQTPLPRLDLSGLPGESQSRVMTELIKHEWKADFKKAGTPMYHVVLIKYNERRYDLFFQIDHSIFDVTSGQIMRRHILQRYRDLQKGVRKAMEASSSYQEYLEQIRRGPIGIDADGLIAALEIDKFNGYLRLAQERMKARPQGRIQQVRCKIDLTPFQFDHNDDNGTFELVLQIYILVVSRLLEIDGVPFLLLFQNRRYQSKSFNDVVGLIVDGIPMVVPVDRAEPSRMTDVIRQRMELINKHNINFFNLIWNLPSLMNWWKLFSKIKSGKSSFFTPLLMNYAGSAEAEYGKIWDFSLELLEQENQEKLDYADFYGVAKVVGQELDFLILCKFEPDIERVRQIVEEETAHLLKVRMEKKETEAGMG